MSPAKSVPEGNLGNRMILAVAISYVIDGALLSGFAATGTISFTIPLAYTAIGLLDSSLFLALHAWAVRHGRDDGAFAFAQGLGSSAIQIVFPALGAPLAFYFFRVLFVVFGCASLGLSKRRAAIAWIGVAIAAAVVMSAMHAKIQIPQATLMERALVWMCFVATLGRCIVLGVFGRDLRLRLQDRRRQLRGSIHMLKEREKYPTRR